MRYLCTILYLASAGLAFGQERTGDGSRENPFRGEPAPLMEAIVLYEEIRDQKQGRFTATQLEEQLKKRIPGRAGEATWEVTVAHQLSMLTALLQNGGEYRMAAAVADRTIAQYNSAESVLSREGASAQQRARMAAHAGKLQEEFVGDAEGAEASYQRALALDPSHEQAKRSRDRLEQSKLVKPTRGKGGEG